MNESTQRLPEPTPSHWLTVAEFTALAEISRQKASGALGRGYETSNAWRSHTLTVRKVQGTRGRGGFRYEVLLSSLPPQLQARYELTANAAPAPDLASPFLLFLLSLKRRLNPLRTPFKPP